LKPLRAEYTKILMRVSVIFDSYIGGI